MTGAQRGVAAIRTPQWQIFAGVLAGSLAVDLLPDAVRRPVTWVAFVLAAALVARWFWARHDDAVRARREASGWVVSARASSYPHQVRTFEPESQGGQGRLRHYGVLEIRADAAHWRVTMLSPWLSSFDVTLPWSEVAEVECLRARWNGSLDVCCFSLRDGRELTLYVTRAVVVERAIKGLGVQLSSQRFGRSQSALSPEQP